MENIRAAEAEGNGTAVLFVRGAGSILRRSSDKMSGFCMKQPTSQGKGR